MAERWVLNASPIIALAHVGLERLLVELPDEVVVPEDVVAELVAGPPSDPALAFLVSGRLPTIDAVVIRPEIIEWDLGRGETAVLSLALGQGGWTAVIDDAAARRCARSFEIPHKGTLALVIMARQRGLIPSAAEAMRRLMDAGLRLDADVVRDALRRTVDEDWPP
jgi:predicted nucleic acid-binding protein